VPKEFHLSETLEKAEYDKHENSLQDPRYRKFLGRLHKPLMEKLTAGQNGLDFGCGPGPALAKMFEERGMNVELYDQFYQVDKSVLSRQYDFVSATEVVEHFRLPAVDLNQLWLCVRPNGYLGLMSKLVSDLEAFATWHYKNDPTHIAFFSLATLHYLSRLWGAELEVCAADAFILRKPLKIPSE